MMEMQPPSEDYVALDEPVGAKPNKRRISVALVLGLVTVAIIVALALPHSSAAAAPAPAPPAAPPAAPGSAFTGAEESETLGNQCSARLKSTLKHSATCIIGECDVWHGPTDCSVGKCSCKPGYCAKGGQICEKIEPEVSPDGCVDCPEYVALTAEDKLERLMLKLRATRYKSVLPLFPADHPEVAARELGMANRCLNGSLDFSFDRYSDEYPEGFAKQIHTYGSVASVSFNAYTPKNWVYVKGTQSFISNMGGGKSLKELTGLFKGAAHGVLKFSVVKDDTKPFAPGEPNWFAPSIGVKMLRDHTYSGNLLAQVSLGSGQGADWNPFSQEQKIWLPVPDAGIGGTVVATIFGCTAKPANRLDCFDFAAADEKGNVNPLHIIKPNQVVFMPRKELTEQFDKDIDGNPIPREQHRDVRPLMETLVEGTVLYDLVIPDGSDCLCDEKGRGTHVSDGTLDADPCFDTKKCDHIKIGEIVTTSELFSSSWSDFKLFFQHDRYNKRQRMVCEAKYDLRDVLNSKGKSVSPGQTLTFSDNHRRQCVPCVGPFRNLLPWHSSECECPDGMQPVVAHDDYSEDGSCPFEHLWKRANLADEQIDPNSPQPDASAAWDRIPHSR